MGMLYLFAKSSNPSWTGTLRHPPRRRAEDQMPAAKDEKAVVRPGQKMGEGPPVPSSKEAAYGFSEQDSSARLLGAEIISATCQ